MGFVRLKGCQHTLAKLGTVTIIILLRNLNNGGHSCQYTFQSLNVMA